MLCGIKVAALILALDPAGLVAFQLPKALTSRALEWPMAAALAWSLVAFGPGILPRSRLHPFVIAMAAVSALSAVFAGDRYLAVFGDPENYAGLTFLVDMAVLYAAVAAAVRSERDVAAILAAVAGAGGVAIAYGAAQAIGLDPLVWAEGPARRPFATFGNADHFGHFLSVCIGLGLGATIAIADARARALALAGTLAAVAVAAIVATRGTLVGMAAAAFGRIAIRRPSPRQLALGLAALILAGAALAFTPLGQRTLALAGGPLPDRLLYYDVALRATLARPLLGYGPENFRAAFAEHRTVASVATFGAGPQSTAHDWVLDASATTGVAGLAALLALVAAGSIELWRLARSGLWTGAALALGWIAYWANGLVAASSLAASWYPWLALGAAAALRGSRDDAPWVRRVPVWVALSLAIVALVGAASGARAFQANRDAWAAEEAAHYNDRGAATLLADRAAARDGGRADNWNRLGLALEAEGRWPEATAAYREATDRARYEVGYWTNFARALARLAGADDVRRNEAIVAARQATIVDPNAPIGHVVLAEIAIAFGRCDLAREETARAAALGRGYEQLVARAQACR